MPTIITFQDTLIHVYRENAPVIEKEASEDVPIFLPDKPRTLLEKGKFARVPVMMGYADNEGILKQVFENQDGKHLSPVDFTQFIPNDLNLEVGSEEANAVLEKLKGFYTSEKEKDLKPEIDVMTDTWFLYGIYSSLRYRLEVSDSPIYFYRFTADTAMNTFKRMNPVTAELPGKYYLITIKDNVQIWMPF